MIDKTLHKKLKIELHEPHYEQCVNTGAATEQRVPAPLVASVVLLLVHYDYRKCFLSCG